MIIFIELHNLNNKKFNCPSMKKKKGIERNKINENTT